MAKRKKTRNLNNSGETWRSRVKRMEQVYGCLQVPVWKKYPHLKEVIAINNNATVFVPKCRNGNAHSKVHPFLRQIMEFRLPFDYQLICEKKQTTAPSKLRTTDTGKDDYSVTWISTVNQLSSLIETLRNLDHLFIDLEGYNVRSFRGITSLLQIFDEVHRTVYFVDTLALYNEMERFHPILSSSKIIKVMHGSHNDIRSFEKDFSLYVVGLVDAQMVFREYYKQFGRTGHFKNISFEPSNISYKTLVNGFLPEAKLEKSETFTDFRQRPLNPAQQKYAFLDVWYLPYVYFTMMGKLNLYRQSSAVELSKQICIEQRFSFSNVNLDKKSDESEAIWQLRRLRHYIALKEDLNPEFLCPPSTLIKLRLGGKPVVEKEFFQYPLALEKALRGEDGVIELETEYSDLNIPFPYSPPPVEKLIFCCKHWALTDHKTKDCTLTKEEIKAIKKKHYKDNPDKKANRNRENRRREKSTAEKRRKVNKRNAESKKRNLPESFVKRREKWYQKKQEMQMKFQNTTNEINYRQLSKGIVLGSRKKQYALLMRQKYRDKLNTFINDHMLY